MGRKLDRYTRARRRERLQDLAILVCLVVLFAGAFTWIWIEGLSNNMFD